MNCTCEHIHKNQQNKWESEFNNRGIENNSIDAVIEYAHKHHLENLIAVDNTASSEFTENYIPLIENGFDLVSSNKIANTNSNGGKRLFKK